MLNLTATEMEEDKHLDARHAIEEAMSELFSIFFYKFWTAHLSIFGSPCAHAKLSQVPERFVRSFGFKLILAVTCISWTAFIKELGVRLFWQVYCGWPKFTISCLGSVIR